MPLEILQAPSGIASEKNFKNSCNAFTLYLRFFDTSYPQFCQEFRELAEGSHGQCTRGNDQNKGWSAFITVVLILRQ